MTRLLTQARLHPSAKTARVEIAFEFTPRREAHNLHKVGEPATVLAVLAYDDPVEALRDACEFMRRALEAVEATW